MALPTIQQFNTSTNKAEILDSLFEYSPALHKLYAQVNRPFSSYSELIGYLGSKMMQLVDETAAGSGARDDLISIIAAHPRLGEPKQALSQHSSYEQRNLGSDTPQVTARLAELNKEYEIAYPGLRFVVFVNGRSRQEIIELMEQTIASGASWFDEVRRGISEMCCIANDRVKKCACKL